MLNWHDQPIEDLVNGDIPPDYIMAIASHMHWYRRFMNRFFIQVKISAKRTSRNLRIEPERYSRYHSNTQFSKYQSNNNGTTIMLSAVAETSPPRMTAAIGP